MQDDDNATAGPVAGRAAGVTPATKKQDEKEAPSPGAAEDEAQAKKRD